MTTATKTTPHTEPLPVKAGLGFIAGDVYSHLLKVGDASLNDLKKELHQTPAMLGMAVGWLAREDKVSINKKGAGFQIRLNHRT